MPNCPNISQSDGQLPHLVNIQFRRKTTIQVALIFFYYILESKILYLCNNEAVMDILVQ